MKHVIYVIAILCAITSIADAQTAPLFNGATATRPASDWTSAFLTGNGVMGAMMFGEPYDETVVLNHCRLFVPRGSREIVQPAAQLMPELKEAGLAAGANGPAVVHEMLREKTGQTIIHTDPFHPAFFMKIRMADAPEDSNELPDAYLMTEDFETGELTVRFADEQGYCIRRMFASRPDGVVVVEIFRPKGRVSCTLSMEIDHPDVEPAIQSHGEWLTAHTVYKHGKGGYDSAIRVVPTGGVIINDGETLTVQNADRILLLMKVDNWKEPLPPEISEAWAYSPDNPDFAPGYKTNLLPDLKEHLSSLPADYRKLFLPHAKAHGELFSRVTLDLGGGYDRNVLSEELLDRAAEEDRLPLALAERMYDACRYLIICSAGDNPPNLQGIWTGTWTPAWSGDYTVDSNIQLESQSMLSCNMPDLMQCYYDTVDSWLPDCRLNARKFYGCRGIVSNPRASNTALLLHWGRWPGEQCISCMGWMLHFYYDYYLFTGDREFLEQRVVPLLKESVLFYEDLLAGTEDENGRYRFFISYSPEHRLYANAVIDIATAKAMLTYLTDACEELDIEQDNIPRWKAMLDKMPPYIINEGGYLQEWALPGVPEDYNQRHHSHFLPLYQYCEFDPETTPELWQASHEAFQKKVDGWLHLEQGSNSNHITHGMMNQAQCAARLGRHDIISEVLTRMATRRYINPSFMMSYWPDRKGYGFDAVGTIPDVVNNSLIFAWGGTVDLLPAVPREWTEGSIEGILARGQLHVDRLAWDLNEGRLELTVTSDKDQTVRLRMPESMPITSIEVTSGDGTIGQADGVNTRSLTLPAGCAVTVEITFDMADYK